MKDVPVSTKASVRETIFLAALFVYFQHTLIKMIKMIKMIVKLVANYQIVHKI